LSNDARISLIQDYANDENFADGLIYLNVLEFWGEDAYAQSHWCSRMTPCKAELLYRLFSRSYKPINDALKKLKCVPALFEDFRVTFWHKIFATKCDAEFIHYLELILDTFMFLLGKDNGSVMAADPTTVRLIQSRCPGSSREDLDFLCELMNSRRIFPAIDDQTQRQRIWERLASIDYLIPSLSTLQQDYKFLEPCGQAMYSLLKPKAAKKLKEGCKRPNLRDTAKLAFNTDSRASNRMRLQISMHAFAWCHVASDEDHFFFAYHQLALCAQRYCFSLTTARPLKELGKKTPEASRPDPIAWSEFANVARRVGFESPEIVRLLSNDPYIEKARQTLDSGLIQERKAGYDQLVNETAEFFRKHPFEEVVKGKPEMVTNGSGESIERRHGRVRENAVIYNKKFLFLDIINKPVPNRGQSIMSLFVRRSVFHAFFGNRGVPVLCSAKGYTNDQPARHSVVDLTTRSNQSLPPEGSRTPNYEVPQTALSMLSESVYSEYFEDQPIYRSIEEASQRPSSQRLPIKFVLLTRENTWQELERCSREHARHNLERIVRDYRTIDREGRGIMLEESYEEAIHNDGCIRLVEELR
jgi:hypothetical protein